MGKLNGRNPDPDLEFRDCTAEELAGRSPMDGWLLCMARRKGRKDWFPYHYRPGELDNADWID